MSLLTPDSGLLFWMLLSFLVVFGLLAKFGFPAITGMIEERKKYIDDSLKSAHEANEKLSHIKEEGAQFLIEAREKQAEILKEAMTTRDRIVSEAKSKAEIEGSRLLDEARKQIQTEKEAALADIREQVAELSVGIAEKVLRKELESEKQQMDFVNRLLDEVAQK